jgi:hypothetical protein
MNAVIGASRTTAIKVVERYNGVLMSPDQENSSPRERAKSGFFARRYLAQGQWQVAVAMQAGSHMHAKSFHFDLFRDGAKAAE